MSKLYVSLSCCRCAYYMQINEVNAWVTRALLEYPFKVNTDLPASQYLLQFTKVSESEGHAKENDDDDDLMIWLMIKDGDGDDGCWNFRYVLSSCFLEWKFVNFKWYLIETSPKCLMIIIFSSPALSFNHLIVCSLYRNTFSFCTGLKTFSFLVEELHTKCRISNRLYKCHGGEGIIMIYVQYIPKDMCAVHALFCFVVVRNQTKQ